VAAGFRSHIGSKGEARLGRETVSNGRYSVELFRHGSGDPGQEEIVDRHDNLTVARAIYRGRVSQYPGLSTSSNKAAPLKLTINE
jgi:hypothetical protein